MPSIEILHNPRCSKSRAALKLLEENGANARVTEYLKDIPTTEELDEICRKLSIESVSLIRAKEPVFKELGLNLKDDRDREEWLDIMVANPKLIERPIIIKGSKAVIGRPPENLLELL